jgi:XrtJ-associated TM-motif-TM protein
LRHTAWVRTVVKTDGPGGGMMSRVPFRYAYLGLFLLAAFPLRAQGGCVDSQENPTAILGLIGAAGAFYIPLKKKLSALLRGRRDL